MDYKLLLKKYMGHVLDLEGVVCVPRHYNEQFTLEERQELKAMSEEVLEESCDGK